MLKMSSREKKKISVDDGIELNLFFFVVVVVALLFIIFEILLLSHQPQLCSYVSANPPFDHIGNHALSQKLE